MILGSPTRRAEAIALLTGKTLPWRPLPGPQTVAFETQADVCGYGGAAGGGKTDLAVGLALTMHQRVTIFRPIGTELPAVRERLGELVGSRDGYNGKDDIWRITRHDGVAAQIRFGAFQHLGDEQKYRGHPNDLMVFDEAAEMREAQVRFVLGWLRSTDPRQRKRALLNFNPPSKAQGRWILGFFGPWLDRKHPKPAKPGELRWFAVVEGRDIEVDDGAPFVVRKLPDNEVELDYDFDPALHKPTEIIRPETRTFVPSRVTDNPHLFGTGYVTRLQGMPEPLRSQLLNGDFQAGIEDDAFQVIPTAWVEAAMARWKRHDKLPPMDSLGADIALGGRDKTELARRHGMWFDEPISYPGVQCKDGPTVAGFCVAARRDGAVIHLDLFGVGAQPYGHLMQMRLQVVAVNMGDDSAALDSSGTLEFFNLRSQLWWQMREALEPARNTGIALPPGRELLADLTAPVWEDRGGRIYVCSRDEIVKKIGRSPDRGTAYILALLKTPKRASLELTPKSGGDYNPHDVVARMRTGGKTYNPHRPGRH